MYNSGGVENFFRCHFLFYDYFKKTYTNTATIILMFSFLKRITNLTCIEEILLFFFKFSFYSLNLNYSKQHTAYASQRALTVYVGVMVLCSQRFYTTQLSGGR